MSSPQPRNCLVCGAATTSAHYGVDACRACTVFYRKARKKKLYACRASTRRCDITQDGAFACKRCRYDRFERVLRESGARDHKDVTSLMLPPNSVISAVNQAAVSVPLAQTARPLLDKCAVCYKMFSAMRRNSELNERPNPIHPSKIAAGEYEIIPSTYGIMNSASRFLLNGILDIADVLFPEFSTFSKDEQWTLAVNYYTRFFMLESCYHADKVYPDNMNITLCAYTAFMSVDVVEHFFDDCPNKSANLDEAKKFVQVLTKFIGAVLPSSRIVIQRAKMDEHEFLAVLILCFWFSDCLQMRDEIVRTAEKYRQMVLKELQAHYREDLKLEDYAARIGELFMLMFNFDRSTDVDEHFEIYRLLGVFADDTFVYRLRNRSE